MELGQQKYSTTLSRLLQKTLRNAKISKLSGQKSP